MLGLEGDLLRLVVAGALLLSVLSLAIAWVAVTWPDLVLAALALGLMVGFDWWMWVSPGPIRHRIKAIVLLSAIGCIGSIVDALIRARGEIALAIVATIVTVGGTVLMIGHLRGVRRQPAEEPTGEKDGQ